MIIFAFLLAVVIGVISSLVEALIVHWIGPYTGIGYFDTATYWNIFFLVVVGNLVAGSAGVSSSASKILE